MSSSAIRAALPQPLRDMGPPPPPLSTSPSLTSFESYGTGLSCNYETDRLRALLSASQEDLALQKREFDEEWVLTMRRHEERIQRERERFDNERRIFEGRIAELEQDLRGEGSGLSCRV